MDLGAYVEARHTLLVRLVVLLGRPPGRARALVGGVLAAETRAIRGRDDPDADVLAALHRAVLADRAAHPDAQPDHTHPDAQPDHRAPDDPEADEGLVVRAALAGLSPALRDPAVLAYGTQLGARDLADVLGVRPRDLPALADRARAALGAEDDDDARRRLAAALGTIPVERPGPLPAAAAPRHDARRLLLLALAVAVVAGGISLVLPDPARPDRRPADPPARPAAVADLPRTLRGDQVPSLLGYRLPDALDRLHDVALVAAVERVDACEPPDVVLATSPGPGADFRMGDGITVTAAERGARPCPGYRDRAAAWAFLGFAAGREPPPRFAGRVRVVVDGGAPRSLSRSQAGSPRAWGGALARVADAAARVGVDSAAYVTPTLVVRRAVPAASACGLARPAALGRRTALELSLTLPTEAGGCPFTVDLYRAGGRLDAVVVRGPRPQRTDTDGAVS